MIVFCYGRNSPHLNTMFRVQLFLVSCTMLKELLTERRKTMGCPLIFCCDKFNFWYVLIIFRVVIFTANRGYLP